jgi:hypothetical protein
MENYMNNLCERKLICNIWQIVCLERVMLRVLADITPNVIGQETVIFCNDWSQTRHTGSDYLTDCCKFISGRISWNEPTTENLSLSDWYVARLNLVDSLVFLWRRETVVRFALHNRFQLINIHVGILIDEAYFAFRYVLRLNYWCN